jgi:hypothetical protein
MARSRKKRGASLRMRLLYLLILASGGGSVGSWIFKDHPAAQAIWSLFTGKPAEEAARDLDNSLRGAIAHALEPADEFRTGGVYQVTIPEVHLDPSLFKAGHTVDIQARVLKLDPQGHDTTLWDTKPYGERLAVVGRDELSAGWPYRPFQVDWSPGQQLLVEVFDRHTGLFAPTRRFVLAAPEAAPREFPLKSGSFPLQVSENANEPPDPRNTRIVLKSQRIADLPSAEGTHPARVAPALPAAPEDPPIIIR